MSERSETSAYLEAYRGAARPDAAARARMWDGLARRAAAGEVATIDDDDAPAIATVPRRAAAFAVLGLSSAAAVMIGWAASSWWAATPTAREDPSAAVHGDPGPASQAASVVAPPARAEPPAPAVAPSETRTTPTVAPAPAPQRSHRRGVPAPRDGAAAATAEPSISADEIAALRRAQALVADDPHRAIAVLDDHRDRWPHSSLAAERSVARLAAMCSAGDRDAARRGAASFERDNPDSPLLPRVRGICRDD